MDKPEITAECVETKYDSRFVKLYDLQYQEGKHYLNASRRSKENLVAIKSEEEFKVMLPDAVTVALIVKSQGEYKLLLNYEYRYPAGQFLLSPPAGLIDPEDVQKENPLLETARREVLEETGITLGEQDALFVVNPLLFSSPGMTDESNALVCAISNLEDDVSVNQNGAVGTECFDGYRLVDVEQAEEILRNGRDEKGVFYSVYTWAVLMYYVSEKWRNSDI